jgi:hypothetical protein
VARFAALGVDRLVLLPAGSSADELAAFVETKAKELLVAGAA